MSIKILVVGNNLTALSVIRGFAKSSYSIDLAISSNDSISKFSNLISEVFFIGNNEENYTAFLDSYVNENPQALIIPTDDKYSLFTARYANNKKIVTSCSKLKTFLMYMIKLKHMT